MRTALPVYQGVATPLIYSHRKNLGIIFFYFGTDPFEGFDVNEVTFRGSAVRRRGEMSMTSQDGLTMQ